MRSSTAAVLSLTLFSLAHVTGCALPSDAPAEGERPSEEPVVVDPDALARATLLGTPGMGAEDLRAALLFSVYTEELAACLDDIAVPGMLDLANDQDYETALALQRCVVFSARGHVETASLALGDDDVTAVDLPLLVPPASVLGGEPGALLAIADVMLYADDDGDGAFDETPLGAAAFVDRVVGTSRPFREEDADDSFFVWREGELSPLWKLYRGIYGCEDPPAGLATVTLELLDEEPWARCVVDQRPVPVELAAGDELGALACEANPDRHVPQRPPMATGLPAGAVAACVPADGWYDLRYTVDVSSVCPRVERYDLVGCSDLTSEAACAATYWDLLGNEPGWWPCRYSDGRVSLFVTSAGEPSGGADELFTLSFNDGLGLFALEDVVVTVGTDDMGGSLSLTGAALDLVDNDDNGVFNAGDELLVSELDDVFGPDTTPGSYPVTVLVGGVDVLEGAPRYYVPVPFPTPPTMELTAVDAPGAITEGVDDVAIVTRGPDDGPAFALEDVSVGCYVGGELPVPFTGAAGDLALASDADGDGRFGAGDALLVREPSDAPLTPELLMSFGSTLYCDVQVDMGVDAWAYVSGFFFEVQ